MVPFHRGIFAALLLAGALVSSSWAENSVEFVPADTVTIATQGNRIAFDFRRWPARPIQVYADALATRSNFLSNGSSILDNPGDFLCYDRTVFILSNLLPDRTYTFFFASYVPRDRTLYISSVYNVRTGSAETDATGGTGTTPDPATGGVARVVTQFVTNTEVRVETREVPVTNTVERVFTNWPPLAMELAVDYDQRTVKVSGSNAAGPLTWVLVENRQGRSNAETLSELGGGAERKWSLVWRPAAVGGGNALLEVVDGQGTSVYKKALEIYFPDAGAPQTTNVALYPHDLAPYQPVGPTELIGVMNLFQNGYTREAAVLLGRVPVGDTALSSRIFWQAVLDYSDRGDVESAVTGFYRVIKMGAFRAEVFRSYLWISMIFLQDKARQGGRYVSLAREYLETAYAMAGESDLKDDILYYQAVALKAQGETVKLRDHLRFIRNAHLIHGASRLWDISLKRTVELLPRLEALEAGMPLGVAP